MDGWGAREVDNDQLLKTKEVLNTVLNLPKRCYVLFRVCPLNPFRGKIQNPFGPSLSIALGWGRGCCHLAQLSCPPVTGCIFNIDCAVISLAAPLTKEVHAEHWSEVIPTTVMVETWEVTGASTCQALHCK